VELDLIPKAAGLDGIADVSRTSQRAAILTSEGDRESAVNSARGKAEAQILDAEARQRLLFSKRRLKDDYPPSPSRTPAASPQGSSTAEALQIIAKTLKTDPAREAPVLTPNTIWRWVQRLAAATAKLCSWTRAVSQPRWRGCQLSQTWLRLTRTRCFQPNCHRSILTTAFNRFMPAV